MRNSILVRLLAALSFILIISTGVSLYCADKNVRQIVEEKQVQLFAEKIDTIVKMLEARSKRLELTSQPDAYREDFQQAALSMIRATYYTKDTLSLQSYPLIIDSDRKTILHPFLDNKEDLRSGEALIRDSLQKNNGGEHIVIENPEVMGVFSPFKPWGWQIGYLVPVKVMYDASNRLRSILFWTWFIGTLSALSVISFTVYRIVKPLSDLRKATDALASGDYSRPFNNVFNTKDEVGSLALSLDRMRIVIQERIAELKGTNIILQEEIQAREKADAARLSQEHDYQEIFNATSEAIVIFDTDDRLIVHANNTMLRMFGYTRRQLVGQEIGMIFRDYGQNRTDLLIHNIEKAIAGDHLVFEWRIKKQDSAYLWTEISLRSATIGEKRCVLAVFRDVSERKLAEREKSRMEEQLRHVQQMEAIGTLAGGIAHDFNNLLTPLIGYAELLIMQLEPESEQQREAKAIHSAGLRARDLVKQILTISRKGDMTLRPVMVQEEVAEAYSLVHAALPKNITIICEIDESCEPVLADPGQIHQMIMNLSTNGYHAMKETGGVLSISLEKMVISDSHLVGNFNLEPGCYVKLVVSDTGVGITGEIKKKIFDPYYTTKIAGEGTGLGLSIVNGIVKSINGHITVESEHGKTVFTVYLPCIREHMEFPALMRMDELQKGDEAIMLVDDEESVLDVSRAILEGLGYNVCSCNGSISAIESFRATPDSFDLIVTDMTMPGLSGFELSLEIKKIRSDIPIILLTGYSDIINKDEAKRLGIYAILTKPIHMSNFSSTVRNALDNHSSRKKI